MSDSWPFPSSPPPPPIMHHSSLSHSSPFMSPPPPLSSPLSPGNHGNAPHAKVSSYHLPEPQVTPLHHHHHHHHHLPPPQVTSPHITPETQATPPHLLYQPQDSSPLCAPWSQVTSPHLPPQSQVPSSPLTHVTSPHFPHPYVTSPHLPLPPQHHLSDQSPDPGLDPQWIRSEGPDLRSFGDSYQNQTHLDPHLQNQIQNQNQFSGGVPPLRDENTHRPLYNSHTLLCSAVYQQGDSPGPGPGPGPVPGPVQDTWGSLGPTLSQLQCSPLGPGDVVLGRWGSVEFSSSPAEDSSGSHFFYDGGPDLSALQPFCSPNTPGLSPHYPQTPTISSPGPPPPLCSPDTSCD